MRWRNPNTWWRGAVHEPRQWQREALEAIYRSQTSTSTPPRVCVQAVMGAGKSVLLAELCAAVELPVIELPRSDEGVVVGRPQRPVIVVTTSTRMLVDQLAESLRARGLPDVGRFFTDAKEIAQVVVACNDSLGKLAAELAATDRRCAMLIVDEAHRSSSAGVLEAIEAMAPDVVVGLTATPYRATASEELSAFDELVFQYGPVEALRDGVVVPWDVHPWDGAECTVDEAAIALAERARHRGPGVFNAKSCADADRFAKRLRGLGWSVEAVHSKRDADDNAAALAALRSGDLEAVVHVNMLSEGVNIPELRWMVLRRVVKSRVRFAQEVGRGLRACPGKVDCWFGDPNDLFAVHKLTYEAVLNGQAVALSGCPIVQAAREVTEIAGARPPKVYQAEALDALALWMRRAVLRLERAGHLERKCKSHSWRKSPTSPKQHRFAASMLKACARHADAVPEPHRSALRHVCAAAARRQLNRGQLSDLIELLVAVRKHEGWPGHEAEAEDLEVAA